MRNVTRNLSALDTVTSTMQDIVRYMGTGRTDDEIDLGLNALNHAMAAMEKLTTANLAAPTEALAFDICWMARKCFEINTFVPGSIGNSCQLADLALSIFGGVKAPGSYMVTLAAMLR